MKGTPEQWATCTIFRSRHPRQLFFRVQSSVDLIPMRLSCFDRMLTHHAESPQESEIHEVTRNNSKCPSDERICQPKRCTFPASQLLSPDWPNSDLPMTLYD